MATYSGRDIEICSRWVARIGANLKGAAGLILGFWKSGSLPTAVWAKQLTKMRAKDEPSHQAGPNLRIFTFVRAERVAKPLYAVNRPKPATKKVKSPLAYPKTGKGLKVLL